MRARTLPDGTLVITYAAWLELFSAVALMAIAAWALLDPTVSHRVAGWVCAGLSLLLFALYERSVFEFHPGEGRVKWTRVRLLRRRRGDRVRPALPAPSRPRDGRRASSTHQRLRRRSRAGRRPRPRHPGRRQTAPRSADQDVRWRGGELGVASRE